LYPSRGGGWDIDRQGDRAQEGDLPKPD
jgi:hypothetical protein